MERKDKMIFSGDSLGLSWSKDISSLKIREEEQDNLLICLGENVQQWIEDLLAKNPEAVGILLGQAYRGENGACLVIDGALQAKYIEGDEANFRFTHESWQDIQAMQDQLYPDKRILGWFRVTSSQGFSTNDLVVQKLFFKQPWQVIYLLQPGKKQGTFFRWKDKEIIPTAFFALSLDKGGPGEEKATQPKILVSQKRRKRISSRRLFLRRIFCSSVLVALIAALTFEALQFWRAYEDLLSLANLKTVAEEGIKAAGVLYQNILEVVTNR